MAELRRDLTILVVDDYEDMRSSLVFTFRLLGIRTLEAKDGNEALEKIATNKVDTVITDIRMPNKDGIQLLDEVRRIGSKPPIILMSGFADISLWDAYARGAEGFLSKPFSPKLIKEQVRKLTTPSEVIWAEEPTTAPSTTLEVTYRDSMHAESEEGFCIGRGGIFIGAIQRSIRKDAVVALKINIKGSPFHINGVGTVRWVRNTQEGKLPVGAGIEFNYLSPESRESVASYINKLQPTSYIPKEQAASDKQIKAIAL